MKNLLGEFGIKPKVIDYGRQCDENKKYRAIEVKNKLLDIKINKKRKNKDD